MVLVLYFKPDLKLLQQSSFSCSSLIAGGTSSHCPARSPLNTNHSLTVFCCALEGSWVYVSINSLISRGTEYIKCNAENLRWSGHKHTLNAAIVRTLEFWCYFPNFFLTNIYFLYFLYQIENTGYRSQCVCLKLCPKHMPTDNPSSDMAGWCTPTCTTVPP